MNALVPIAVSAAAAGLLDLAAATLLMRQRGVPVQRMLQFIASAILGPAALEERDSSAWLGLILHFVIATLVASAYYALSLALPEVAHRPIAVGAFYGILVHLVMSLAIVPISRAERRPFSLSFFVIQLAIHVLCVGIPIALIQAHLH